MEKFFLAMFLTYNAVIYLVVLRAVLKIPNTGNICTGKTVLATIAGSIVWSQLVFVAANLLHCENETLRLLVAYAPLAIIGTVLIILVEDGE